MQNSTDLQLLRSFRMCAFAAYCSDSDRPWMIGHDHQTNAASHGKHFWLSLNASEPFSFAAWKWDHWTSKSAKMRLEHISLQALRRNSSLSTTFNAVNLGGCSSKSHYFPANQMRLLWLLFTTILKLHSPFCNGKHGNNVLDCLMGHGGSWGTRFLSGLWEWEDTMAAAAIPCVYNIHTYTQTHMVYHILYVLVYIYTPKFRLDPMYTI